MDVHKNLHTVLGNAHSFMVHTIFKETDYILYSQKVNLHKSEKIEITQNLFFNSNVIIWQIIHKKITRKSS